MKDDDRRLVQIYYARGVSLERSNRWNEAERDFRQALKLNPERAEVLNYLGYSFVDKGINLEEAVSMLEKARALRPLDGMIADSVGWAYYKLGRFQEAARTLEEAVQLAPGASDINDHLGDAYWRIGRKIDARFQWQHALQLDPDEEQKAVIERKLQFGLDLVSASGSVSDAGSRHASRGLARPRSSISFCMSATSGPTAITRCKASSPLPMPATCSSSRPHPSSR